MTMWILAQMGRDDDAYAVLDGCDEPDAARVVQVRRDIAGRLLGPYVDLELHNGG
jgi:hypothetical protein